MTCVGKFKLTKSENFDEYMKALGVSFALRKMAATATSVTEITQDGDTWNIKTSTTFKTTEIQFKLGEEFDETTVDGRQCKSVIKKEGDNTLVHLQTCNGETLKILREFSGDEMTMTLEAPGDVVCTRVYHKQ